MNAAEFLLPGMPTQIQQNVFEELGIDQLPPERQEEVLTAMTEVLLKRLTLKVLEKLTEAQQQEFEAVCAAKDQEKITKFFGDNVPGYDQLIQDEIAVFKADIKKTTDALLA